MGAIKLIRANYATGYTIVGFANIISWSSPSSSPIVASDRGSLTYFNTTVDAHDYDPATLAVGALHGGTGVVTYPQQWGGTGIPYHGLGIYVYADLSTTALRVNQSIISPISSSNQIPDIITDSVFTIPGPGSTLIPCDNAKFVYAAGVPVGLWTQCVVMTQDMTACYVFTSPTQTDIIDRWFKIVDGIVVSDGDVDPVVANNWLSGTAGPYGSSGRSHQVPGQPSTAVLGMFENNGIYMWAYQGTAGTNLLGILRMDGSTLKESDFGTIQPIITGTPTTKGVDPSLYALATDGYCGFASGHNLMLFGRLPAQQPHVWVSTP